MTVRQERWRKREKVSCNQRTDPPIEDKALRKLRHPSRSRKLKDYLKADESKYRLPPTSIYTV